MIAKRDFNFTSHFFAVAFLVALCAMVLFSTKALGWMAGHGRITNGAIETLPQWQKDFLGDQNKPLAWRYSFYPDWHHGKTRAETAPYIMPELKTGPKTNEMALHVNSTEELKRKVYRFYVDKALPLMANPETKIDGIKFMGTFIHLLEDRGCPAHSFPKDLFFKKFKMFAPPTESDFTWLHGPIEDINVEYTTPKGYKPQLLATNAEELVWVLLKKNQKLETQARSYILPILEQVYKKDKKKKRALQNEIAQEVTKLVADFIYTSICIATKRFDQNPAELQKISAAARTCKDFDIKGASEQEISDEYKRLFSWGNTYADLTQRALATLLASLSDKLSTSQKKAIAEYANRVEQAMPAGLEKCAAALRLNGNALHMFSGAEGDRDILEFIMRGAIENLQLRNMSEAGKYLGLIAHVIADRNSPADLYTKDYISYYFRDFLPAPENKKDFWQTAEAIFAYDQLLKLTARPKSLGESAGEITFNINNRLRNDSRLLARQNFIPLIRALQKGDKEAADHFRQEIATNAIADIADVYYSIFAVAFGSKVETATNVSFVEVSEVPPTIDPTRSWEYSLYRNHLRHHWNLMPYCGIIFKNISGGYNHPPTPQKPLMLWVDNKVKTYPIGLAQSKDFGHCRLSGSDPDNILQYILYQDVTCIYSVNIWPYRQSS